MRKKIKGPGGKLSRSEIIQARISPKLKFALDIMAQKQHRTASSLIECLIENTCKSFMVTSSDTGEQSDLYSEISRIWHYDEGERFVRFALAFPELLTDEQEQIWQDIRDTSYFWRYTPSKNQSNDSLNNMANSSHSINELDSKHLNEHWESIKNGVLERAQLFLLD